MKIHKRRVFSCAVSLLCAAAVAVQGLPYASAASAGKAVTMDYLNLRQGAGTNTKVLLTLGKGVAVTVLDNSNAQWAKVRTQSGNQGYCSKQYLMFSGTPAAGAGSSSAGTAVTTANLNLRGGASLSGNILCVISKGAAVTVLDNSNAKWAKVRTRDGRQGWCSKEFLKISGAAQTPSGSSPSPAPGSGAGTGTALSTDYLNLRQGAGTNTAVILTISKGTTVTVLDKDSNAQWARVRTPNGKEGWCSKQYLRFSTPSSGKQGTGGGKMTATTTAALNLRSGAGTQNSILLTLPKSTLVEITDNSNAQWAKVKTSSGKEGWCSKQYLNISVAKPEPNKGGDNGNPPQNGDNSSEQGGNAPDSGGGTDAPDSRAITGASVKADVLRLREQPNTSGKILDHLPNGTLLTVLDVSVSGWVKVKTPGGKTGYVSAEFVTLHYEGDTPAQPGQNSSAVSLSSVSQTVPQGKTLFLKATTSPSGGSVSWTSSNPAVATVANGYVLAVSKGSAVITASSGSGQATCAVSVSDSEPVRTAYAAPNIVGVGETVTLTAVTDTSRDGVRFVVTLPDGGTRTVAAKQSGTDTVSGVTTKKWTGTTTFGQAGRYSFTAYSSTGGSYSASGYSTDLLVATQSDFTVSTNEARRVSDKMLSLIAKWEGASPTVYTDTLSTNQVATVGYGYTLSANETFYNNLSNTEMWSLLVNRINNASYTTELNKMIRNNHFLMNQNQADCLISFAYNVGAGYFNSSNEMDFIKIMKNAVVPPSLPSGGMEATVTLDADLLENSGSLSSRIGSVPAGTTVTVTDTSFGSPRDGWYRVELSDGTSGWVNSGYVRLYNSDTLVHDLNYTNAYAFGSELIRWNLAGGKFYTGLFYRRLGEANVYNYNDYSAARSNLYGYRYPSTAAALD